MTIVPEPFWPLAEHIEFGQNAFDGSIGSGVIFCIKHIEPSALAFFNSLPFHRLLGSYHAWKEQVRVNKGILLSIDGIQPDAGNETIYLLRDVFTGRILHAENTTESTKERLKQILAAVVALNVPVIGVISDAQPTELQAVAEVWPGIAHQICQFHVIGDAGRLIYQADARVRNDMRARIKQKTQAYRQNLHKRFKEADGQEEKNEQEMEQLHILEEYAATVEGALQLNSIAPFEYGGLATQAALIHIQESLEKLEKKEEC